VASALRALDDYNDPWCSEYCGMANWLLTTPADITPGSTLPFRGLGHVTSDHDAAAEHMLGYIHAHPIRIEASLSTAAHHPPTSSRSFGT
jgi:hypothetical protein